MRSAGGDGLRGPFRFAGRRHAAESLDSTPGRWLASSSAATSRATAGRPWTTPPWSPGARSASTRARKECRVRNMAQCDIVKASPSDRLSTRRRSGRFPWPPSLPRARDLVPIPSACGSCGLRCLCFACSWSSCWPRSALSRSRAAPAASRSRSLVRSSCSKQLAPATGCSIDPPSSPPLRPRHAPIPTAADPERPPSGRRSSDPDVGAATRQGDRQRSLR